MKICLISDTHGKHKDIVIPQVDVLIHAGDITGYGTRKEVNSFLSWFSLQKARHKIMIAGNHDFYLDTEYKIRTIAGAKRWAHKIITKKRNLNYLLKKYTNVTYLNNTSIVIKGIRFYGSPITPLFHDWAFNRTRGSEIRSEWNKVHNQTDVLITHGPPFNIGDATVYGESVGCEQLLDCIKRVMPKIHVFGHIHEAYGMYSSKELGLSNTTFINASILDENYLPNNEPIIIDYEDFI